jgi:hypothetical protein
MLDGLAAAPARAAMTARALPPEQHLMQGLRVITDEGVAVNVPPLHHHVVTAKLTVGRSKRALHEAQQALERALRAIESRYAPSPSGLSVIVTWGMPYFREYIPRLGARAYPRYLPVDLQATRLAGHDVPAFQETERFPSDPATLALEQNDVCFVFQSDSLDRIVRETTTFFHQLTGLIALTSVRKGFAGGGFDGKRSLPKAMAMKAGIPGADLIPERAPLFLGFTSTQRSALGPDRIANFETLPGFTDQWPNGYFRNGTTMHLSHLYEDVDVWYRSNVFADRVWLSTDLSRAANNVGESVLTLPEGPADVQTEQLVEQFATDRRSQRLDPTGQPAPAAPHGQLRHPSREGHRDLAADRLQHARSPVLLDGPPEGGRPLRSAGRRHALPGVLTLERLLPSHAPRDGRTLLGRCGSADRSELAADGPERRDPRDAPAELPRAAAAPPFLPARRAPVARAVCTAVTYRYILRREADAGRIQDEKCGCGGSGGSRSDRCKRGVGSTCARDERGSRGLGGVR